MLIGSLNKVFNYRSILKAAQAYKNSAIQEKMHEFSQDQKKIEQIKNSLDFESIHKQSKGYVTIRQFLFQQKVAVYQTNFPQNYVTPSGKWTRQQLFKLIGEQQEKLDEDITPSEEQNRLILANFSNQLQQKFEEYYLSIGKKGYTFSVREEVEKMKLMTPRQFEQFLQRLSK